METLKQQVVLLRQFLRALANDQLIGDEITNVLLTRIDMDLIEGQPAGNWKTALFSAALESWRTVFEGPNVPAAFTPAAVLLSRAPEEDIHHQAAILVDIMEFNIDDTAKILKVGKEELERLLDQARSERKKPVQGKTLVIEDEALIADEICEIAEDAGVEILGPVATRPEAVSLANSNPPDLILSDYDLGPGGTGLDAVKDITSQHNSIAIFITGFPEEVLTGEDYEPAFVLKKPYDTDAVHAAIFYALGRPRVDMVFSDE